MIKLRDLSGPKQMTAVVGGDGEAVKPLLDFFLEAFDSDLCVENVQNVSDRDFAGVLETYFMERGIDVLSFGDTFLQDLVCVLKTAVTAVAHGHDVQVFFFGQGEVVRRREEIGAVAEVLEGISATAELLDLDQLDTERVEYRVCGRFVLPEINRCGATAL